MTLHRNRRPDYRFLASSFIALGVRCHAEINVLFSRLGRGQNLCPSGSDSSADSTLSRRVQSTTSGGFFDGGSPPKTA